MLTVFLRDRMFIMKRTITAVIAAATALSLAVVPAQAAESSKPEINLPGQNSSKLDDKEVIGEAIAPGSDRTKIIESIIKDKEDKAKALGPLTSSLKSDKTNGWAFGTTFNILLGTGIAALLLVVFNFVKGGIKF